MRLVRGDQSYQLLLDIFRSGGPAIIACDTIYGFVGPVPVSEMTIRDIKGREETKPFLQLIADPDDLPLLGYPLPPEEFIALWPGPFTYVLKSSEGSTTAFRVPEDERLRRLVRETGVPLYSTSVNRAGEPPLNDPDAIVREFGKDVALIEDSGLFTGRHPSTVVNLAANPFVILRQGAGTVPPEILG